MKNTGQKTIIQPKTHLGKKEILIETNLTDPLEEVKKTLMIHLSQKLGEALVMLNNDG